MTRVRPGNRAACLTAAYAAEITDGAPGIGDGELSKIAWSTASELPGLELTRFARALLSATGTCDRMRQP